MFLLSGSEKLVALLFLLTTMLGIGLTTGVPQLRSLLASRDLLVRVLLGNFLIVPVAGLAIARMMPLAPESAGAITLLACFPGGQAMLQFTTKIKPEKTLAGATVVLLNVLALIISPLILRTILPPGWDLTLPYGRLLGFIALLQLVPLGIGMYLCAKAPAMAPKLSKAMGLASFVLFVAFMAVTKSFRKEAVTSLGGADVAAMVMFVVVSMAVGWFLCGPVRERRRLFAIATSIRNVALCLLIAKNTPSGHAVLVPLVAFSLLMLTPSTVLTIYSSIRGAVLARKAARPAGQT